MKTHFPLFIILTFLLSGCTSVHLIEHNKASYSKTNSELQGKKAQIILTDGEIVKAENIEIADHTISYDNPDLQSKQTVPVSEVNEITFKNRGKGALTGFGIAALIGGVLGAVTIGGISEGMCEFDCDNAYAEGAVPGAIVGALAAGLVIGLPIGAGVGNTEKSIIKTPGDSTNHSVRYNSKYFSERRGAR
jgi:hypothetical protein